MSIDRHVAEHYTHGNLAEAILAALAASGKNAQVIAPADLAPVDEMHIGGRRATAEFAERLGFQPGLRLLDVGCGIGGPSRLFAPPVPIRGHRAEVDSCCITLTSFPNGSRQTQRTPAPSDQRL